VFIALTVIYPLYCSIVYFIAVALTAAVFINERKSGLLDRSIVAGMFLGSPVFFVFSFF
jgi:hypothetical protein